MHARGSIGTSWYRYAYAGVVEGGEGWAGEGRDRENGGHTKSGGIRESGAC